MKRKLSLLLALVLVFSLVLTACGGPKEPTPGADQPGTSAPANPDTPAEPRTDLNLRLYAEPTTLDPQYSTSTYDMAVIYQIFDNLFEIGPGGYDDMQYSLCTSYEMNETAMEYVFHIREGVYFSNGDLLTAEDVAFSIKRMVESPVTSMRVYFISNVEVIDEYTVKCTLSLPCTRLPQLLSTATMTIVNKKLVEQYGSNSPEMLVGTGAYKLEKWTPGQGIVLTAYEEGWRGAPAIKTLNYKIIPDMTAGRVQFQNGELDVYYAVSAEDYELFANKEGISTYNYDTSTNIVLAFNASRPILSDVKIRQAIAHAINSSDLSLAVSGGLWQTNKSVISEHAQGYTDDVTLYEYDTEKAKQLLAEAGYNGEPIRLLYTSGIATTEAWATTVEAFLRAAGVNITMEGQESATVIQRVTDADFDLCMFEYGTSLAHPVSSFHALFHSTGYYNVFRYATPELDEKIIAAYACPDLDQQTKLLQDILIDVSNLCLFVPCYSNSGSYFAPSNLHRNANTEPAFGWIKLCYATWEN